MYSYGNVLTAGLGATTPRFLAGALRLTASCLAGAFAAGCLAGALGLTAGSLAVALGLTAGFLAGAFGLTLAFFAAGALAPVFVDDEDKELTLGIDIAAFYSSFISFSI